MTFEINSKNAPKTRFEISASSDDKRRITARSAVHKSVNVCNFLWEVLYGTKKVKLVNGFNGFSNLSKHLVTFGEKFAASPTVDDDFLDDLFTTAESKYDNLNAVRVVMTNDTGSGVIGFGDFLALYLRYSKTFRDAVGSNFLGVTKSYPIRDAGTFYDSLSREANADHHPSIAAGLVKNETNVDNAHETDIDVQPKKEGGIKIPLNVALLLLKNAPDFVEVVRSEFQLDIQHKQTGKRLVITGI